MTIATMRTTCHCDSFVDIDMQVAVLIGYVLSLCVIDCGYGYC